MSIRYVNTITASEYNRLRDLTDWVKYTDRQMQIALENSAFVIAAMDGDKVVGAARFVSDGAGYGIIADVIVSPEYRGAGIGRYMVNSIIEHSKTKIQGDEIFSVNLMAAKGRESFYQQLGFTVRDEDYGHGMFMRVKR